MSKRRSIRQPIKQKKKKITARKKRNIRKRVKQTKLKISKKYSEDIPFALKRKASIVILSSENSEIETNTINLPKKLLLKAQDIIKNNNSITSLRKAIKIYDIDETINYTFLDKCKKITSGNYKYIYTLNFSQRKNIVSKFGINQGVLEKSSKILFSELIEFLKGGFKPDNKDSVDNLENFKLLHFDKYIIPISEGNIELKYYYFINIVLGWLKKYEDRKKVKSYILYFENFLENKVNLDKIDKIFYIIFRIDLMYFNGIKDSSILKNVNYSIDEEISEKKAKLLLIKDKICEKIDKIEINEKTVLTLKENNMTFNPFYYCFGQFSKPQHILDNIINRDYMSYDYFKINRINYFNDEDKKKEAFINYVNLTLDSRVLKEYFKKIKSFQNYEFPFNRKDILEYMWSKVIYTDLDDNSCGYTNREGFGIFLNRNKGKDHNGIGYGANLVTVDHEFVGHSIRYLINSNNKLKAGTGTPNDSFVSDKDNILSQSLPDGGDKFELMLFGGKLTNLTIGGNHFLFDIMNWNLPLEKFRKRFNENNIQKNAKDLKIELRNLRKNSSLIKVLFNKINYENVTNKIETQSLSLRTSDIINSQTLSMRGFR